MGLWLWLWLGLELVLGLDMGLGLGLGLGPGPGPGPGQGQGQGQGQSPGSDPAPDEVGNGSDEEDESSDEEDGDEGEGEGTPTTPPSSKIKDIDAKFKLLKESLGVNLRRGQNSSRDLDKNVIPKLMEALEKEHRRAEIAESKLDVFDRSRKFLAESGRPDIVGRLARAFADSPVAQARVSRSGVDELENISYNLNKKNARNFRFKSGTMDKCVVALGQGGAKSALAVITGPAGDENSYGLPRETAIRGK